MGRRASTVQHLQVHDDVDKVLDRLKRAGSPLTVKVNTLDVVKALEAYGSVVASLDAYMDFDRERSPSVLDGAARESLSFRKTVLPVLIGEYARCLVTQLRDP